MNDDDSRPLAAESVMNRHPEIFREKDLPASQTCMCWGLEIGEGWFGHVDRMCSVLDEFAKRTGIQVVAQQVKQKFGELRFYYSIEYPEGMDETQANHLGKKAEAIIDVMEVLCAFTCERCGEIGTTDGSVGWINCFCQKCRDKKRGDSE